MEGIPLIMREAKLMKIGHPATALKTGVMKKWTPGMPSV